MLYFRPDSGRAIAGLADQTCIVKELKNVLTTASRPSLETGTLLHCPNQRTLSHWSSWESVMAHTGWM